MLSDQTGLFHHPDAFLHAGDHQEPQKSHYYLAQDPGSDTAQRRKLRFSWDQEKSNFIDTDTSLMVM